MHNDNWRTARAERIRRLQVTTSHPQGAPFVRRLRPIPPLRSGTPHRLLWTAGATVLLGSCADLAEPGPVRQIGFIGAAVVENIVPVSSLQAGVDNIITVFTFGSSSCTAPDDVEIIELPEGFVLTPYDLVGPPAGSTSCTDDLAPQGHDIMLNPGSAGVITLFVRGLARENGVLVETTVGRDVTVE